MSNKRIGTPGEARRFKYDHSSGHSMDVQNHDESIENFMRENPDRVYRLKTAAQGGKNLKRRTAGVKDGEVIVHVFTDLECLTTNSNSND